MYEKSDDADLRQVFLSFRDEAGKINLERFNFNLHDFILGVHKRSYFLAKPKEIEVVVSIKEDVPKYVAGDPTRLEQILINLLGNAIKFTGEQGRILIQV